MVLLQETALALGTLFPVMNPISTAFVFMAIAHNMRFKERKELAKVATITATIVLIAFLVLGRPMLGFFGITIYAFKVAGGVYLAKVGFDMMSPQLRKDPKHYDENGRNQDLAIIPLAIPLLSGPGSITTVLVLADVYAWAAILAAIILMGVISYVTLVNARHVERFLGKNGTAVIERLLGLIVLVIAVQFVFNGITGYLATL